MVRIQGVGNPIVQPGSHGLNHLLHTATSWTACLPEPATLQRASMGKTRESVRFGTKPNGCRIPTISKQAMEAVTTYTTDSPHWACATEKSTVNALRNFGY
jgi:hypothetical protein